jgi:hypothetical protein
VIDNVVAAISEAEGLVILLATTAHRGCTAGVTAEGDTGNGASDHSLTEHIIGGLFFFEDKTSSEIDFFFSGL